MDGYLDDSGRNNSYFVLGIFGRVDQTVVANGTLQPMSGKMTVAHLRGIVSELFVNEGEIVTEGARLMVVESEGTNARLQSTKKQLLCSYENQLFNVLLDHQVV